MASSKPRRLDQWLANCGYCSRSEARPLVRSGRVTIDGERATDPGEKVRSESIRINGEPIEAPEGLLAVFHKPAGYVCSHDGREGPSVFDLLPARWMKRNPVVTTVGRLDKDTTGVLLLTDIGPLVQHWTSPRHKVPKLYEVVVDGTIPESLIEVFARGDLMLADEEKPCLPARLEITGPSEARLELTEGRYHQVKRMFGEQGLNVLKLHRSHFGTYTVESLEVGKWRMLEIPSIPGVQIG
jgi:16S rRNA pseudouridine516 synthase